MSYKATQNFSFDGKTYVEGQEVNIDNETIVEKLKSRGQIGSGKGKSVEDVEAEKNAADAKASKEGDEKRAKEAYEREKEFLDRQGKPKVSAKMKVEDQTEGIKEKSTPSGPNAPKK